MLKTRCECRLAKSTECRQCRGTGWREIKDDGPAIFIGLATLLGIVIVALMVAHAHFAYGDWACAFAECRRVVP